MSTDFKSYRGAVVRRTDPVRGAPPDVKLGAPLIPTAVRKFSSMLAGFPAAETIYNPYKMRAYQTNAQTLTDGAQSKVTFDTESFDTNSSFSTITNNYVTPATGFYFISAKVAFNFPAVNNFVLRVGAYIFVTPVGGVAASVAEGTVLVFPQTAVGSSWPSGVNVFDTVALNLGDVVDIRITVVGSGGVNWVTRTATSDLTYCSIHLVSV